MNNWTAISLEEHLNYQHFRRENTWTVNIIFSKPMTEKKCLPHNKEILALTCRNLLLECLLLNIAFISVIHGLIYPPFLSIKTHCNMLTAAHGLICSTVPILILDHTLHYGGNQISSIMTSWLVDVPWIWQHYLPLWA